MNDSELVKRSLNPLLERARFPGETFALPSKGLLYTNGELSEEVNKGEVLVFPMVTLDEIAIKTPDKLLNGTAITEVFSRCIPQVLKPLELFNRDIDFLLICLRKVSYGNEIQLENKHNCKDAKNHSYIVDIESIFQKVKNLSQRTIKNYILTLPNGQVVNMSPPRYGTILKFYQTFNENQEQNEEKLADGIITTILNLINSVDGITDRNNIEDWLRQLPLGYINKIREKIPIINDWGVELNTKIQCKDCNKSFSIAISLNPIDFFS